MLPTAQVTVLGQDGKSVQATVLFDEQLCALLQGTLCLGQWRGKEHEGVGSHMTTKRGCFLLPGCDAPIEYSANKESRAECDGSSVQSDGFLMPFVMTSKCLFQELWQLGLHWDEPLPSESAEVLRQ